jgi:hypothetical protein
MVFGWKVAVYCYNYTKHTQKIRTSQESHYVPATDTKRLMLFKKTFAVYCKKHMEHHKYISYLTGNTLHLIYKDHSVNTV